MIIVGLIYKYIKDNLTPYENGTPAQRDLLPR